MRVNFLDFYKRYRPLLEEDRQKLRSRLANLPTELPVDVTLQHLKDFCGDILSLLFSSATTTTTTGSNPHSQQPSSITRSGHRSSYSILQLPALDGEQQLKLRGIQLGVSKVFLRQAAYDSLESRRARLSALTGLTVQRFIRGSIVRLAYLDSRYSAITVQKYIRGFLSRKRLG